MKTNWNEISGIANYSDFTSKGAKPIFRKKVILDDKGEPVNHIKFRMMTGDLSFIKHNRVVRLEEEKEKIKELKSRYKSTMRSFMGEHWRKISNTLGIYNYTEDIELTKQVKEMRDKLEGSHN